MVIVGVWKSQVGVERVSAKSKGEFDGCFNSWNKWCGQRSVPSQAQVQECFSSPSSWFADPRRDNEIRQTELKLLTMYETLQSRTQRRDQRLLSMLIFDVTE